MLVHLNNVGGNDDSRQRQTLERQIGRAAGDQIGRDPRRAAGHGPAHVAVAGVVVRVAKAAAEHRRALGRHRPQAGPVCGRA